MNVLEASIRLGKLLQKTEEGKHLLQLETIVAEKYKNNSTFGEFDQFVERNSSRYYFYSWDMSYQTFINILNDNTSIEHREIFIPTAKTISSDDKIYELVQAAVSFGNIFEKLVSTIISGDDYQKIVPKTWKFKVKNAISDIQIAVERTMLMKTIATFYKKNNNILDSDATKKYLTDRENKNLLPFSKKAFEAIEEATEIPNEEKILYEKMYLITEVVKKGIFYGFWEMINEVSKNEIVDGNELSNPPMQEVTFSHASNSSSFLGKGWLYRIQLDERLVYFLAHKRTVSFGKCDNKTTVSGIIYPQYDRMLFEKDER